MIPLDQKDFDYVPLLAMEPAFLFTLAQRKEKTSLTDVLNAEPEKGGKDLHSYYVLYVSHITVRDQRYSSIGTSVRSWLPPQVARCTLPLIRF